MRLQQRYQAREVVEWNHKFKMWQIHENLDIDPIALACRGLSPSPAWFGKSRTFAYDN